MSVKHEDHFEDSDDEETRTEKIETLKAQALALEATRKEIQSNLGAQKRKPKVVFTHVS